MGLWDAIKNEFIQIIEWLDDSNNTLVYRFPVHDQEIKMGAQLTVRENQVAIFVNEGQVADVFKPGRYELSTQNMPVLSTLRGWKYGFDSPFKAEVYFFNTRLFTDLKWGTQNPVMMRDAEFGMIRMRAFGTYAIRISEPREFFKTVVGTQGLTTTEDILVQLRSTIVSNFSDIVAESKIAALDLAASYRELAQLAQKDLTPSFNALGLELARFNIDNISLPEEVEAAIDQRTKLGVLGDRMNQYTQMQAAESIKVAAANPGGVAGAGVGFGAGMAMGNAMGNAFGQQQQQGQGQQAAPPPPPSGTSNAPRWSLAIDGKTYGPYTDDGLKAMVQSGQVAASTQAWRPGAAGWAAIDSYPELGGESSSAMPPPPPPPLK
ncbi:MAG TPA: SPFH domain-containing protein [Thermoanaerobaculia bacterium]|jgi:membrane protease subunit (stomatin/prohibitin family)|nr:SPFH domain-containing protein [Thermoanaerobaculia bacterium]